MEFYMKIVGIKGYKKVFIWSLKGQFIWQLHIHLYGIVSRSEQNLPRLQPCIGK